MPPTLQHLLFICAQGEVRIGIMSASTLKPLQLRAITFTRQALRQLLIVKQLLCLVYG